MNNLKPSHLLAALAWVSLFALTWLALFGVIPFNVDSIAAWVFFAAVAVAASAVASEKKKA